MHNVVRRLSRKSLKFLPPDVRFQGQNATHSILAETPLEEFTALPQTP